MSGIREAVSDQSIDEEARDSIRRQTRLTKMLLACVANGDGHQALIDSFHRVSALHAVLLDEGGEILAGSGIDLDDSLLSSGLTAGRYASAPVQVGTQCSAFSTGDERSGPAVLIICRSLCDINFEARALIEQVIAHIRLTNSVNRHKQDALVPLAQELMDLTRVGEITDAGFTARLRALGLSESSPLLAVATVPPLSTLRGALQRRAYPHAIAQQGNYVVALLQGESASVLSQGVIESLAEREADPVLGFGSSATGYQGVRRSLAEAVNAVHVAGSRQQGQRVVRHSEVGSFSMLLDLLDPVTLCFYRTAVLGSIEEWDAQRGTNLLSTLRAFLESGGQWRTTARRLHMHHNTLRHRMRRVEQLTGRDLDSTRDRADFYLALDCKSLADDVADPYNPWTPVASIESEQHRTHGETLTNAS